MTARSLFLAALFLQVGLAFGQQPVQDVNPMKLAVVADMTQAAKMARVDLTDALAKDLLEASVTQSGVVTDIYKSVHQEARVQRLAAYLAAKESVAKTAGLTNIDVRDFHWGYLKQDLKFAPVRIEAYRGAKLTGVELQGKHYGFKTITPSEQSKVIVLPVDKTVDGSRVTAVFDAGKGKSLWTGQPGTSDIKVSTSATSKGCEVVVNSTPQKAAVYFNRREWYELTNTSSVREPGILEVVVKLPGHKDWRAQRALAAGDSWTIDAHLTRE